MRCADANRGKPPTKTSRMRSQEPPERHTRMLRAWQLAILRFAVTLDDLERLNILAIARELDRLGEDHETSFHFFRRTSAELCAAVSAGSDDAARATLLRYLAEIDDPRLKRAFAAAVAIGHPETPPARKHRKRDGKSLWRGLASRGSVRT
jgi:hypothetical protein